MASAGEREFGDCSASCDALDLVVSSFGKPHRTVWARRDAPEGYVLVRHRKASEYSSGRDAPDSFALTFDKQQHAIGARRDTRCDARRVCESPDREFYCCPASCDAPDLGI